MGDDKQFKPYVWRHRCERDNLSSDFDKLVFPEEGEPLPTEMLANGETTIITWDYD